MTITERPSDFNAVHLPIIYKFSNDKWPTNTVDTVRTATQTSDSGYTKLALSGDIKASGSANELEYLKVEVNGVEGIYQIYTWYSDTSITIDLEYDASNTIGNVQYYYSNYHQRFKIYAGLRPDHAMNSATVYKPYQLLTEIKAVPDQDSITIININEILKSDIDILSNNRLTQVFSPDPSAYLAQNDIDSFTEFYIEYAEGYDQSDGYTITTFVSSYTDDSSEYRIAVNAATPFRMTTLASTDASDMSFYYNPGAGQSFNFLDPAYFYGQNNLVWDGYPFKVWFLKTETDDFEITVKKYDSSGSEISSDTVYVNDEDEGLYGVPITISGGSTMTIGINDPSTSPPYYKALMNATVVDPCEANYAYLYWKNSLGGTSYWLFTSDKERSIDITETKEATKNIFIDWPTSYSSGKAVRYETKRVARRRMLIRAENLTKDQVMKVKEIKLSPSVFIGSYNDPYMQGPGTQSVDFNVIVDDSSFTIYSETDKLYSLSFEITFTDNLPIQSL